MAKGDAQPVPWKRGSRGSSLALGIDYKQRVINGKLVDIDPRTDLPVTKKARQFYKTLRKTELKAKTHRNQARNRELLGKAARFLEPGILRNQREQAAETLKILEDTKLSDVPISNFDPSILKAEGIDPNREWLRKGEADRLFRRQELEGEIQQAKFNTANEQEIRLNAQSKSPKIRTSLAGDDNFGLGIGPVDPKWMPSGMEVGTQVDGIPQGPLDKPITTTTKEKTDDTNKAIQQVEKNSAFTNSASGNGTADTMKIANKDLKFDDPNYKLSSIQQKLVDGGWTRKELQIKREQHQKWLKDNNRI